MFDKNRRSAGANRSRMRSASFKPTHFDKHTETEVHTEASDESRPDAKK